VPLDKSEGFVKGTLFLSGAVSTAALPEKVEGQGAGISRVNHFSVELRSTNHRFGHHLSHDSSMRTSRPARDARAPNQFLRSAKIPGAEKISRKKSTYEEEDYEEDGQAEACQQVQAKVEDVA